MATAAVAAAPRMKTERAPKDIHQTVERLASTVRASFLVVINDPAESTLGKRMQRAALVQELYDECAHLAQRCAFVGGEPRDPHALLSAILEENVSAWYQSFVLGSDYVAVSKQYTQLRRVITEAKVLMQPLALFHGKDYIEDTIVKLVTTKVAKLDNYGMQQMIASNGFGGLQRCRELLHDKDESGFRCVRDHVKNCFLFALTLLPASDRKRLMPQLVRIPYVMAVEEQLRNAIPLTDVDAFLDEVSATLDQEFYLASQVIPEDPTAPEAVKLKLQKALLTSRSSDIVEDKQSGVVSTLQFPNLNPDRFRVLLNVFDFSAQIVETIKRAFAASIAANGISTTGDKEGGQIDVIRIADVYAQYSAFLAKATQMHHRQTFHRVLNDSISTSLDASLLAVTLSEHFDALIRKGSKLGKTQGEQEQGEVTNVINRLSALVPLTLQPELFVAHYKQRMSVRMLATRHPSAKYEEYALRRIALHTSVHQVLPMQRMLHEALLVRPSLDVSFCNMLVWPPTVAEFGDEGASTRGPLCAAVHRAIDNLAMAAQHPEVTVKPEYWLSTGDVTVTVNSGSKCRVFGVVPQLAVLSYLFQDVDGAQSVHAVAVRFGMQPMTTFCVVRSLVASGLIVEVGKEYAASPSFVDANNNKKIALPIVPTKSQSAEVRTAGLPSASWPQEPVEKNAPPLEGPEVYRRRDAIAAHLKRKEAGNTLFKASKHQAALDAYYSSLKLLPSRFTDDEVNGLRNVARSNIVLTLLSLRHFREALSEASSLLLETLTQDLRRKVVYRRGLAAIELADLDGAIADFQLAKSLSTTTDAALDRSLDEALYQKKFATKK